MKEKITPRYLFYFVFAIFSIYIGYFISNRINPNLAGLPKITSSEAEKTARDFLNSQNISLTNFSEYSYFTVDQSGSNYILSQIGIDSTKELLNSDLFPLSFWHIDYLKQVPLDKEEERIWIRISPQGKVLSFAHLLPDSASSISVDSAQALAITKSFLENWPNIDINTFSLETSNRYQKPNRTDFQIIYHREVEGVLNGREKLSVYISGNKITTFNHYFNEPAEANVGAVGGANILLNTASILLYLAISILCIIIFLKLYHDGQIGVKRALLVGLSVYIFLFLNVLNMWDFWGTGTNIGNISRIYTKFIVLGSQMAIFYVYLFSNSFSAWAVGDFYLRTIKPKILSGIDSLLSGKLFSSNVGRELPIGFIFGAIAFGIIQVVNYLIITGTEAYPRVGMSYLGTHLPAATILFSVLITVLFEEVLFRKFFTTYLKKYLGSLPLAIIFSALGFAIYSIFFGERFNFWPSYYTILPFFVFGIIQAWIFWQYGLLAAMSSAAMIIVLEGIQLLLSVDNSSFLIQGIIIIALFSALFCIGLIGFFKGKKFDYSAATEPEHIKRIKEKARVQREMEIAKKVQLSLLPKEQPAIQNFDIAGICIPALEVGGDYFDFIALQDGKLGLAIADVSGKGVPAAIYMTLTKGILQSHAEATLSPKSVLSKVNSLMYRTIDRSWYVSMFYAVLDPNTKKLVFSRAGHNPAIVLNKNQKQPQLLQPAGIGLGLEMGEIFTKTLVEGELSLESGSILVFYTDGFTEAMNNNEEEYGEERFLEFLSANSHFSAQEIISKAVSEIKRFSGDAPQHDDMTIVVLKAS